MNVLLINNPGAQLFAYLTPPIGLYRIQHTLQCHGICVDILDLSLEEESFPLYLEKIHKNYYSIVGYSGSHITMLDDSNFLNKILQQAPSNVCVVVGGMIPTNNYEQWLKIGVHFVILGDGEHPMLALCLALEQSSLPMSLELVKNIHGIAYNNGSDIIVQHNEDVNLELFTKLSYTNVISSYISYHKYWEHNASNARKLNYGNYHFEYKSITLYTSSQCPNNCGYCCSHTFLQRACGKKQRMQMLNAEQLTTLVVHEVKKYGARRVYFSDDEFIVSQQRIIDFCKSIVQAKQEGVLPQYVVFSCQARVVDFLKSGQVRKELVQAMYDAGFHYVALGVESLNTTLLHTPLMNKHGYDGQQVRSLLAYMKEVGLPVHSNFMLFIPESSREDLLSDVEQALNFLSQGYSASLAFPVAAFPGAPAYDDNHYPKKWINIPTPRAVPITIAQDFFPLEPELRNCLADLPSRIETRYAELGLRLGCIARPFAALIVIQLIATALNAQDLVEKSEKQVQKAYHEYQQQLQLAPTNPIKSEALA